MKMREKWRLIYDAPQSGKVNMDRDMAILNEVSQGLALPTLRFYSWNPAALSLGYFQKPENIADISACSRLGIDIVKRPTGGRALLHHRELTYSVVVPESHRLIPRGVLPSYKFFSGAIVNGLRELGVLTDMASGASRGKGLLPGACFDSPSAYEIQVAGKKVVGSAQVRKNGVLLQHGSILLELSLDLYSQVLCDSSERKKERYMDELGNRAAGLTDLGYSVTADEIYLAVSKGFSELLNVDFLKEDEPWNITN
jgi:lipoate-protein ligase A